MRDNKDLSIVINKLKVENLFTDDNENVRKIMNGKIIHHEIIENILTMYDRGSQQMYLFIQERYINHSISIDARLPAMTRFKLCDLFEQDERQNLTKQRNNNEVMVRMTKTADDMIKNIISLSHFRVIFL
jgi:hypothetical protein